MDLAANAKGAESEKLVELVKSLGEEKAREHELVMRERAMKVAEENAKLGWRKLEFQEAQSALRLLPAILAVVNGERGGGDGGGVNHRFCRFTQITSAPFDVSRSEGNTA